MAINVKCGLRITTSPFIVNWSDVRFKNKIQKQKYCAPVLYVCHCVCRFHRLMHRFFLPASDSVTFIFFCSSLFGVFFTLTFGRPVDLGQLHQYDDGRFCSMFSVGVFCCALRLTKFMVCFSMLLVEVCRFFPRF